jgi:hypothetical protein
MCIFVTEVGKFYIFGIYAKDGYFDFNAKKIDLKRFLKHIRLSNDNSAPFCGYEKKKKY